MRHTGKDAGANIAESRYVFWRRGANEQAARATRLWLALDLVRDRFRGLALAGKLPPELAELAAHVDKAIKDNPTLLLWDRR